MTNTKVTGVIRRKKWIVAKSYIYTIASLCHSFAYSEEKVIAPKIIKNEV